MRRIFTDHLSRSLHGYDATFLFGLATDRSCSDPRDKVFAILGLLPRELTRHIQPHYSLSVREVYVQAFLATVMTSCRLGLLGCAGLPNSVGDQTSWEPDFSESVFKRYSVIESNLANGFSAAHVMFQAPDPLHIRGILKGHIKAVSTTTNTDTTHDYAGVPAMMKAQVPHAAEDVCLTAYLWAITRGHLSDRWYDHSTTPSLLEARAIFQDACSNITTTIPQAYREWFSSNLTERQPRRFFMAEDGHLSCGLPSIIPGDKVCVALGSDHPILLRHAHSEGPSTLFLYLVLLYISDMMEGQALLGSLPRPWSLVIDHVGPISRRLFLNSET
jgi:hypothetical protein